MKYDLSVVIPSRCEEFLTNTIQDILLHREGNTEIIAVLDGAWAVTPIPMHKDLTVIYHPKSRGQRGATNDAVRIAKSKYIMKCDAHCAFDQGFDVKMLEAFKETGDNVVMIPLMKNLHAFDWLCKDCQTRTYQDTAPKTCYKCGSKNLVKDILWEAKKSPNSTAFCFDSTPHFQYHGEWKKTEEGQKEISETMSLQGSAFMLTREKYWELNIGDENFGSWGSQGIQISVSFWLSGGRVLCNHRTWYAHMFRTKADFGFPYPNPGSTAQHAKKLAKNKLYENNWPHQIYPSSWLIDKFSPPGWSEEAIKDLKEHEKPLNNP